MASSSRLLSRGSSPLTRMSQPQPSGCHSPTRSSSISNAASQGSSAAPTAGASPLQSLFHHARAYTARGQPLSHTQREELRSQSKSVSLAELGFHPSVVQDPWRVLDDLPSVNGRLHPMHKGHVSYVHLHEDPNMTFGIFMLPANACIPLHNHPGMTVISRLLFGTMHVRAFDIIESGTEGSRSGSSRSSGTWASDSSMPGTQPKQGGLSWPWPLAGLGQQRQSKRHLAQLKVDTLLTGSPQADPMMLLPDECNLHVFEAQTPCALLDLLTPPYNHPGRDCTYYREIRALTPSSSQHGSHAPPQHPTLLELEEYDPDFVCDLAPYMGQPL